LLEQIVRAQARALYRLEELVHDSNAAAAVGACRAIGTVGADLRTSLTAAGLLPGSGDELWLRRQMREAAGAMLDAAEEVGGKPMMDALERRLDANARTAGADAMSDPHELAGIAAERILGLIPPESTEFRWPPTQAERSALL